MKNNFVQQISLYKYRYYIGFGLLAILALLLASYRFWLLPSGLSGAEMEAAATAGHLSPLGLVKDYGDSLAQLVNLPWMMMEWLSIKVFGFTTFAMRLPAVILMLLSGAALIATFWKWSRPNIAATTGLVVLTGVIFTGLARSGTAAAMTIFLMSLLVLLPTLILSAKKSSHWTAVLKVLLCMAAAALIYSPGGLYIVLALGLAGTLHPKTRWLLLRWKPWKLIVAILIGLVILSPLLTGVVLEMANGKFELVKTLLALNMDWSWSNFAVLGGALVGVNGGLVGELTSPIVTIVEMVVIGLGLVRVFGAVLSARSYMILALLLPALVLSIGDPSFVYLLFVPLGLLMCIGFATLVRSWYRLFPFNPYARIVGVVLITTLVGGLALSNMTRYRDLQNYSSEVVYNYNLEFEALRGYLHDRDDFVGSLVVTQPEERFYALLEREFDGLKVETSIVDGAQNVIVLDSTNIRPDKVPQRIVTDWRANDSVLLREYSFENEAEDQNGQSTEQ